MTISESDIEELDNNVDNDFDKNLQLIIQINNELTKMINNLERINIELCKAVSNINNISFVVKLKRQDIQDAL